MILRAKAKVLYLFYSFFGIQFVVNSPISRNHQTMPMCHNFE